MELVSRLILISLMISLMESNPTLQDIEKLEWRFTLLRSMSDAVNSVASHASSPAHGHKPTSPNKPKCTKNFFKSAWVLQTASLSKLGASLTSTPLSPLHKTHSLSTPPTRRSQPTKPSSTSLPTTTDRKEPKRLKNGPKNGRSQDQLKLKDWSSEQPTRIM